MYFVCYCQAEQNHLVSDMVILMKVILCLTCVTHLIYHFLKSLHHMAISAQCEGLILISLCLLSLIIMQKKSFKKGAIKFFCF